MKKSIITGVVRKLAKIAFLRNERYNKAKD